MRTYLLPALMVCLSCGGNVSSPTSEGDGVPSEPPLERPTVEGDDAVFRALATTITVSDNASNTPSKQSQRMFVDVQVGPLDKATGTVPGLSVLLQGEPMPLTDGNPDRAPMPGEVKARIFRRELADSGVPRDRVLHFVFEYRGSRLRYDLILASRVAIQSPRASVSAAPEELSLEWTPALGVDDTTIELSTTHYSANPTTVSMCNVQYSAARREPSKAVFTRKFDAFQYAKAPPCVGRASISNRQSSLVNAPFESLRIATSQHVMEEFTVNP